MVPSKTQRSPFGPNTCLIVFNMPRGVCRVPSGSQAAAHGRPGASGAGANRGRTCAHDWGGTILQCPALAQACGGAHPRCFIPSYRDCPRCGGNALGKTPAPCCQAAGCSSPRLLLGTPTPSLALPLTQPQPQPTLPNSNRTLTLPYSYPKGTLTPTLLQPYPNPNSIPTPTLPYCYPNPNRTLTPTLLQPYPNPTLTPSIPQPHPTPTPTLP